MTSSAKKSAWVTVAILLCALAGALYLYRSHRFAAASAAGISPAILAQLPPDAPAVAYIDVTALRKLQGSPLASVLGITDAGPGPDNEYQEFVRSTGFDYTRDLDSAAIAYWPESAATASTARTDNQMVIISDGRFDAEKIKEYALRTGKRVMRGTQSVYEIAGNPPVAFEFVSETRLAFASGAGAEDLLGKLNSGGLDTAMQTRIERVAGSAVFGVARTDNLPAAAYNGLKNSPQFGTLARSIQSLTLAGRPDGDVIHLTLDGECDTMANAMQIETLLNGFRMIGSMALADPKARGQMTTQQFALLEAFIDQAKVTYQDRWVRLSIDLTPAMLAPGNGQPAAGR